MTILATETRWEVQRKAVLSFATGLIVLAASLSPCEARTIWTMQHATCGGESNCQFLDVVESRALAGAGKLAWRDGMVLNLKLLDGRTIQLADVPEEKRQTKSDMDIVQYRLIEHMAPLNYFLLWVTPAWTEGTPWGDAMGTLPFIRSLQILPNAPTGPNRLRLRAPAVTSCAPFIARNLM